MYVAQGQIAAANSVYSVLLCVSEPIAERIAPAINGIGATVDWNIDCLAIESPPNRLHPSRSLIAMAG